MTTTDAPLTIAFVLLTHSPDEPAGIERAVDSLANGLRELGHRTLIVAVGPPCRNDPPDLVRLNSVSLPRPMLVDEMLTPLPDPAPVREEGRRVLSLADAAVAVVPSTGPESFGNVAAEALSVGTPVISYGLGYLATLTGKAGRTGDLDDGPERLWWALAQLLDDRAAYHAASQQGPQQVAAHTPAAVAREFLHATMAGAPEVS
ncbi:glycosyltransferase [Streptomyces sp. NPDC059455]|uniref:glycosyltransferase n=1 Tax=Streptomyces sp. NPDC059455 TaxID=3346837 RepID=UPI0036777C45